MAKRKSEDDPEIVKQLRPDDTGWLNELRRAHTDPVDLADGDDEPDESPDPPPAAPADSTGPSRPVPERGAPTGARLALPAAAAPRALPPAPPPPPPTWNRPTPAPARSRPLPVADLEAEFVDHTPVPPAPPRPTRDRRRVRPRRSPRRWGVVVPVLALFAGAAIGMVLYRRTDPTLPDPALASGPASSPAAPTEPTEPTEPPETVVVTNVRNDGGTVRLAWIDPTGGEATYVVSQIIDDEAAEVHPVPPGRSEMVITGLDPNATEYCFRVIAILGAERYARSPLTCTANPA